ncbi:MAG: hypothetical protein V3T00_07565 [bacterium]
MLRQILVPLDTTQFTAAATRLAAQIAKRIRTLAGKHVVTLAGLGIVDTDQIPSGKFAALVPREHILSEAQEKVKELLEAFRSQAIAEGIPPEQVATQYTEGAPFRAILQHHVFSDLVILGASCSFPPAKKDYNTLEHLFHHASRPILLTPAKPREVDSVVLAMDGTAPSSRMMYAFAHGNPFPGAKVLLAHSRFEEEHHHQQEFFDRVEAYLRSFKFDVEQIRLEHHMLEALPELVESRNAGAIAIGVHAERFLDRIRNPLNLVRSRVQQLLDRTQVSLFTVH